MTTFPYSNHSHTPIALYICMLSMTIPYYFYLFKKVFFWFWHRLFLRSLVFFYEGSGATEEIRRKARARGQFLLHAGWGDTELPGQAGTPLLPAAHWSHRLPQVAPHWLFTAPSSSSLVVQTSSGRTSLAVLRPFQQLIGRTDFLR